MSAQQAAGVEVRIRDESAYSSIDTTTQIGYAGYFDWGPVGQIVNVGNENTLTRRFGTPNSENFEHFFTAWNIIQYANSLQLIRQIKADGAMNAGVAITDAGESDVFNVLKKNDSIEPTIAFGANVVFNFLAKYPSTTGNELSVAIANKTDFPTANVITGVPFAGQFEYAPADDDEFAVVILRNGEIVESFICSTIEGKRDIEGNNIFVEEVFARQSAWAFCYLNPVFDVESDTVPSCVAREFEGGNHEAPSDGEIQTAYAIFANDIDVDVNVLVDGANTTTATQQYINSICVNRGDCIAILGVPRSEVVNVVDVETAIENVVAYRNTLAINNYFATLYGNYKYQYDRYNDVFRWVPITGDVAGVYAYNDTVGYPWTSAAFAVRGAIRNVEKLAFNPDSTQQGILYKAQVNPIAFFRGEGYLVWGQKTLLTRKSSFDRVTGARLSFVLRKAAIEIGRLFIGEKNNVANRFKIKSLSESILRDVQGKDGITAFYVQADENNNTPDVIDRNELHCYWFYQPAKDAEFIKFELVPTRTGVNFLQLIGAQTPQA